MNRYVIGIDTGGTFTDGVLLHYRTRKVVKTAKTLTTRSDLKIGVIRVLKKLEINKSDDIRLVGLSSTLATNSIAEGKARRVALILIGYDKKLIEEFGLFDKLSTECIGFFDGGHNAQGIEKMPLDEEPLQQWIIEKKDEVDAFAVSSYFSPLNTEHENRAFEIIKKECKAPVVLGHQLTTKIDSIKRATTASVNASLVAEMQNFIEAVTFSLDNLGIKAPLMIVRGDGTLMPCSEAVQKPVETVLSGPAASAIGGFFLSQRNDALIVDVGSTTTDMALVQNGRVVVSEQGARVGNIQTAVKAGNIRTVSIGCDSRIWLDQHQKIKVGPEKVTPLSQLAIRYENVAEQIYRLQHHPSDSMYFSDIEFFGLCKKIENDIYQSLSEIQKNVVDFITDEPKTISEIIKHLGVYHSAHLDMDSLIKQGYIEYSSLTPSDLFHAEGSLSLWDKNAADIALDYVGKIAQLSRKKFIETTLDLIVSLLIEEMIIYLACQDSKTVDMPVRIDGEWGKWMLKETLIDKNNFITINFDSKVPLIGTGAPAELFLKKAAKHLNAKFILPQNFEVANAVGAVSGSIMETCETIVFTQQYGEKQKHVVKYKEEKKHFEELEEAFEYAEDKVKKLARKEIIIAGATDPFIELMVKKEGSLHRFIARAVGNPDMSHQQRFEVQNKEEVHVLPPR